MDDTTLSCVLAVLLIVIVIWIVNPAGIARKQEGLGYGLPDVVRIPEYGTPRTTRIYRSPVAGGILQGTIVPDMTHTYKISKTSPPQSCDLCGSCYECESCPQCQISPE